MKSLVLLTFAMSPMLAVAQDTDAAVKGKDAAKTPKNVLGFTAKSLDGKDVKLRKYRGKVLLIVNTASQCGATPQYRDLQKLHEKYGEKGLAILGFPCNQFGNQEPGDAKEIRKFCTDNYNVTFDMFAKIDVKGKKQDKLFKHLTSKKTLPKDSGDVRWNFEKFLVGRNGKVMKRFRTGTNPSDSAVVEAIESQLKKPAPARKKKKQ